MYNHSHSRGIIKGIMGCWKYFAILSVYRFFVSVDVYCRSIKSNACSNNRGEKKEHAVLSWMGRDSYRSGDFFLVKKSIRVFRTFQKRFIRMVCFGEVNNASGIFSIFKKFLDQILLLFIHALFKLPICNTGYVFQRCYRNRLNFHIIARS